VHEEGNQPSPLGRLAVGALKGYKRFVSPLLPPACRFTPTCSEYMLEAIQVHGFWPGTWLGLKRLGRCHPWHPGGLDPVPPARRSS
jgi:uncharacterized protein